MYLSPRLGLSPLARPSCSGQGLRGRPHWAEAPRDAHTGGDGRRRDVLKELPPRWRWLSLLGPLHSAPAARTAPPSSTAASAEKPPLTGRSRPGHPMAGPHRALHFSADVPCNHGSNGQPAAAAAQVRKVRVRLPGAQPGPGPDPSRRSEAPEPETCLGPGSDGVTDAGTRGISSTEAQRPARQGTTASSEGRCPREPLPQSHCFSA